MEVGSVREASTKLLDRILGFFPRVEAKASFLFAIDTGLLALMALNFRLPDLTTWYIIAPAVIAVLLIAASLYFVYRCIFPDLKGGTSSLVYFQEIAKRTEANFVAEFTQQEAEAHNGDVLGQVWRNAEILSRKFADVKMAFILTGLALIPWFAFLVATAVTHAQAVLIK